MKKMLTYLVPVAIIVLAVGFLIWFQPAAKTVLSIHTAEHTYNLLVDVVRTPKEREQGLMGRSALPEDEGMLFIYETASTSAFWMKDMNFPLDLVFIGSDKSVVEMMGKVPPCQTADEFCTRYKPNHPSRYVLELAGGFVEKYGIQPGDTVSWEE